jgi:hypothetical protein
MRSPGKRTTFVLTASIAMGTAVIGCLPSPSNKVVAKAVGPEYTSTLSKRNSGAMSKGSTLVSLRLNTVPDNDMHGEIVLGVDGDRSIQMIWASPRSLMVSCDSCTPKDVNFEAVRAGEVTITYSQSLGGH